MNTHNYLLTQREKDWIRRICAKWFYNISVMLVSAKRDSIYEYLKDVLPQNKTEEQKLRSLGDLLKTMKKEDLIWTDGRNWFEK